MPLEPLPPSRGLVTLVTKLLIPIKETALYQQCAHICKPEKEAKKGEKRRHARFDFLRMDFL